jgi:hypothetical protein
MLSPGLHHMPDGRCLSRRLYAMGVITTKKSLVQASLHTCTDARRQLYVVSNGYALCV